MKANPPIDAQEISYGATSALLPDEQRTGSP